MTRYHPLLVVLHWLLAVMIGVALIMGGSVLAETANDDPAKLTSLRLHMGAGLAILVLMLARLATRLKTAKPARADIGSPALNTLGAWTHWVLYLVVIAMSLSGIALARAAGLPDIVFGGSGAPLPADFSAYPARAAHGVLSWVLTFLIAGHVAAFVYHQFVRRDRLFSRMWFGARD